MLTPKHDKAACPNPMEIAFRTRALRALCLNSDAMDDKFGFEKGQLLRERLADMRAAPCFADVPLVTAQPFAGNIDYEISVELGKGVKVVLKANHKVVDRLPDGAVDWTKVERVLIQDIEHSNE